MAGAMHNKNKTFQAQEVTSLMMQFGQTTLNNLGVSPEQRTQLNMMSETMKKQLAVISDQAESMLSVT